VEKKAKRVKKCNRCGCLFISDKCFEEGSICSTSKTCICTNCRIPKEDFPICNMTIIKSGSNDKES